jgi:hypothetical protein
METIEEKIRRGIFPEHGLQGLQDLADKLLPEAIDIVDSSISLSIDLSRRNYKKILGILLLSLYAFSPQGRACGLETLKASQITEILERGYTLSTDFKTQSYFHFQPVPIPPQCMELFKKYFYDIRGQALNRRSIGVSSQEFIFLSYEGKRYNSIGKEISKITREVLIHILLPYMHTTNLLKDFK